MSAPTLRRAVSILVCGLALAAALARDAASQGASSRPVLALPNATGSPVNPIAMF